MENVEEILLKIQVSIDDDYHAIRHQLERDDLTPVERLENIREIVEGILAYLEHNEHCSGKEQA